jgi:hypothetical protein
MDKKQTIGAAVLAGAATLFIALKIKAGTSPGPPSGPPPDPAPGLANIYGKVTDKTTGQPINGATVVCVGQTPTNAQGEYNFQNLNPGTYDITFNKDGYQGAQASLTVAAGMNTYNVALDPLPDEPPPAFTFSNIRATMMPCGDSAWMTGNLYGRIANPNSQQLTKTLRWMRSYFNNADPTKVSGPYLLKTFDVTLAPGASQNFELVSNYIDPNEGITYCQFIIGLHQSSNLWVEDEDGNMSAVATLKRD